MPQHFPTVGVIGAGPVSRLLVAPAILLGVDLLFYAERADDSAAQVANHVVGGYQDLDSIRAFARKCTVVTCGETIPQSVIRAVEEDGISVRPGSATFFLSEKMYGSLDHTGHEFDIEIAVMVARSPHGQATAWAPTLTIRHDGVCVSTKTPIPGIPENLALRAQQKSLMIAQEVGVVGVLAVEMFIQGHELFLKKLTIGPHESGFWTVEGSRTSQFEQHLRAILDLPLGDPSMTARHAVMGHILGGNKSNMYRPYLHLMARSPAIKIHQYRQRVLPGNAIGHVTAVGDDLLDLQDSVSHAVDYMSGVIDE
jgi:phosphoribosylaminoimidazole carboxylase (NCAIR synthetase)